MKAEYQDSLVTYIDLIGSSDLIESSENDPSLVPIILQRFKTFKENVGTGNLFQTSNPTANYSFMTFSDLVVRTVPLGNSDDIVDPLTRELFYLALRQYDLTKDGVWMRGGMCRKPVYIDGEFVFGPGLVKAYLLERDWANFPRIIVDRELHEIVKIDDAPFNRMLRQGDDGAYFIDYLFWTALMATHNKKGDEDLSILKHHKAQIEQELSKIKNRNARIKQKIMWLCLYHNSTIDTLQKYYQDDPETEVRKRSGLLVPLKISASLLNF